MRKVILSDIEKIMNSSETNPRKRAVHVVHPQEERGTRCIINCIQPGSYVRPHVHPNNSGKEIWIHLNGRIALVTFSETGEISDKFLLGRYEHNLIEIPPRTFHTAVSLEQNSIMYELSEGPYIPEEYKHFAPWAPEEDSDAAQEYLSGLKMFLSE